MVVALTPLPIIEAPVRASTLDGLDSLLSIVQSDRLYNAGCTEDIRKVIDHLHTQYPQDPLFVVGSSIGSNVMVKYLGEEGVDTPLVGAVSICSPWDLLIGDRFIKRRLLQRAYDRVLRIGLKDYVKL